MQFRTVLLLLVLAAVATFAAINWSAFIAPTALSLGFGTVEAPLGVVMLAITAGITVLFLVFIVYLQTGVLLEARRHARALEESRRLADEAEASRFTELRSYLEGELAKLAGMNDKTKAELGARIDRLEGDLRAAVEQGGTTLSAYIGELEDRIERLAGKALPGAGA